MAAPEMPGDPRSPGASREPLATVGTMPGVRRPGAVRPAAGVPSRRDGAALDGQPHGGVATQAPASVRGAGVARFRHDGVFWRRFAYLGATRGPEWWKRTSPAAVAAILFAMVRPNRTGIVANLRRVRGSSDPLRDRIDGLRTFVEFAYCVSETLEFLSPYAHRVEVEAPQEIEVIDRLPREQGVVVLTSHFGSWEIAARLMQRFGRCVNVVMAREANPSVEAFQSGLRARSGLRVIHSDTSPFASLNMLQALRRGEVVAIQMDRSAPGQVTRAIDFFGAPAPFQYGPFALARLAGVPLWPVFAARVGVRHYRIMPEPLRTIARDASEEQTVDVMRDVVGSFERHVRAQPHQWFQFQPFWDSPAAP
jgi:lauroyl/myristoyl acyltransferase